MAAPVPERHPEGAEAIEELIDYYPIAFPAFFILLWLVITSFISWSGGWQTLAEYYRAYDPPSGEQRNFQSFRMTRLMPASYNGVGIFGADFNSFHLSVLIIFRFMHPPLKIPYSDLTGTEERGILGSNVLLKATQAPGISIQISAKTAAWLETQSGGGWTYERLPAPTDERPDDDD